MDQIKKSFREFAAVFSEFISNEQNFRNIESALVLMVKSLKEGGKIISFGNGGSMSDAMHFAEELTGRYRQNRPPVPALAISDPTHLTCTANDFGFDAVFSRFIEAHGKKGDVAFAISTSGNAGNVLAACKIAKQKGLRIVALTGNTGGKLAGMADVGILVPHIGYSDRIQEIHIIIIHVLVQMIEKELFPDLDH